LGGTNGYEYPANLYQQSVSASASSSGDSATFCSAGNCYLSSYTDMLGLSSHWTGFDFNVYGWGSGDGAIFTDKEGVMLLGIQTSSSLPNNDVICSEPVPTTLEYSNLNLELNGCSTDGLGGVKFTESNGYWLQMNPAPGGTVSPPSGFFRVGFSYQIGANYNCPYHGSGYLFDSWTGSGSGSYTGYNNPATVTMNSPITETAHSTFYRTCPLRSS
jgi:hypothetical protein